VSACSQAYAGKLLADVMLQTVAVHWVFVKHAKMVVGQNVVPTHNDTMLT